MAMFEVQRRGQDAIRQITNHKIIRHAKLFTTGNQALDALCRAGCHDFFESGGSIKGKL